MRIQFSKYQGAGNDFILVDDRTGEFPEKDHKLIQKLCDRKFGIGADGLMLLQKSIKSDFTMKYFNADGFEGTMCGNGGRCLVAFAKDCGHINKKSEIVFDAIDGEHKARILSENHISLMMRDVSQIKKMGNGWGLNTGSMHHVEYVDKIVDIDVCKRGKAIREHEMYAPGGTNVNFVEVGNGDNLHIRTYERGVENETLACGTGSVAAAIVHHSLGNIKNRYVIKALGGALAVSFDFSQGVYHNIMLEGPAEFVFKGEWFE